MILYLESYPKETIRNIKISQSTKTLTTTVFPIAHLDYVDIILKENREE